MPDATRRERLVRVLKTVTTEPLPADDEVAGEILEFFQPEAEEHLQVVSDCLISLECNNNPE